MYLNGTRSALEATRNALYKSTVTTTTTTLCRILSIGLWVSPRVRKTRAMSLLGWLPFKFLKLPIAKLLFRFLHNVCANECAFEGYEIKKL